jgi:hypothetical protein
MTAPLSPAAQAIATALELAEPGARVLRIARPGDW